MLGTAQLQLAYNFEKRHRKRQEKAGKGRKNGWFGGSATSSYAATNGTTVRSQKSVEC